MIHSKVRGLVVLLLLLCVGAVVGLNRLRQSSLFSIKSLNVVWLDNNAGLSSLAIDDAEVRRRLQIPLGKVGLFDVDIKAAEASLLTHEWVRGVKVKRKFPDSLDILVALRSPKALIQTSKDTLRYVDEEGFVFGRPDLKAIANLTVLTNFNGHSGGIRQAIDLINHWDASVRVRSIILSSIYFDVDRGFRALVSYPSRLDDKSPPKEMNKFRTMIDFGQEIDARIDQKINALSSVFSYLSGHSLAIRQIWAEVDKKIVVKTARGS